MDEFVVKIFKLMMSGSIPKSIFSLGKFIHNDQFYDTTPYMGDVDFIANYRGNGVFFEK